MAKFTSESELWACAWGPGGAVYLGTKRSQVEARRKIRKPMAEFIVIPTHFKIYQVRNTREHMAEPTVISFQGTERRPIIGLRSVPAAPENGFPFPGNGLTHSSLIP